MDHKLLLNKLMKLSIEGDALEWLKFCLNPVIPSVTDLSHSNQREHLSRGVITNMFCIDIIFDIMFVSLRYSFCYISCYVNTVAKARCYGDSEKSNAQRNRSDQHKKVE